MTTSTRTRSLLALALGVGGLLGGSCGGGRGGGGGCWEVDADGSGPPSAGPSDGSGGGASQVSGTNNQVAGVDEADFIKNDNRYIYVLGGGKLRILDAWPAATAHTPPALPVEGTAQK